MESSGLATRRLAAPGGGALLARRPRLAAAAPAPRPARRGAPLRRTARAAGPRTQGGGGGGSAAGGGEHVKQLQDMLEELEAESAGAGARGLAGALRLAFVRPSRQGGFRWEGCRALG